MLIRSILIMSRTMNFRRVQRTSRLITILRNRVLINRLLMRVHVKRINNMLLPILMSSQTISLRRNQNFNFNSFKLRNLLMNAKNHNLRLSLGTLFLNMFLNRDDPLVDHFQLRIRMMSLTFNIVAKNQTSTNHRDTRKRHDSDHRHSH